MNQSKIVPGVGVGGLQDKYQIKILICYLLNTIKVPFSREQLNYVFQDETIVNYFSFCDALAELISSGHISPEKVEFDELYHLNELGIETAKKLDHSLPKSLRDNVVTTAMQLLAKIKSEKENEVIIKPYQNGYMVQCMIHEVDFDLMKIELFVPDKLQADKIKDFFQCHPSKVYQSLIQLLIEDNT